MEQYIPKSSLVAEINKKLQDLIDCKENTSFTEQRVVLWAKIDMCKEILSYLDILEVKGVDLEKEATEFVQTKEFVESKESAILLIAKHFYELGLKTKGE